jgi:DNA-binding ferritin-like protein
MDYFIATNARILQTVHWALGTIVTVLLAITGAGWYANFRVYRRDLDALRKDLESSFHERQEEIRHDLVEQLGTIAERIKESAQNALKSDLEATIQRVGDLELRLLKMEFEREMEKPEGTIEALHPCERVKRYCSLLEKAVELDSRDPVVASMFPTAAGVLDRLTQAIEATLSSSSLFSRGLEANEAREVSKVLSQLPPEFGAPRRRIEALVDKALQAKTEER